MIINSEMAALPLITVLKISEIILRTSLSLGIVPDYADDEGWPELKRRRRLNHESCATGGIFGGNFFRSSAIVT